MEKAVWEKSSPNLLCSSQEHLKSNHAKQHFSLPLVSDRVAVFITATLFCFSCVAGVFSYHFNYQHTNIPQLSFIKLKPQIPIFREKFLLSVNFGRRISSDRDQLIYVNIPLRNLEVRDLDRLVDVNSVSLRNLGDLEKISPSSSPPITFSFISLTFSHLPNYHKRADWLSAEISCSEPSLWSTTRFSVIYFKLLIPLLIIQVSDNLVTSSACKVT